MCLVWELVNIFYRCSQVSWQTSILMDVQKEDIEQWWLCRCNSIVMILGSVLVLHVLLVKLWCALSILDNEVGFDMVPKVMKVYWESAFMDSFQDFKKKTKNIRVNDRLGKRGGSRNREEREKWRREMLK